MAEIKSLKAAFIEFIEKLMPSIQDPMSITQQKCQMLINLLRDDQKTINNVVLYIQNLKICILKPNVSKEEDKMKSPIKPNPPPGHGLFQPESYFKLNLPNKDLIIKPSRSKNDLKEDSPNNNTNNGEQTERQTEDVSTPLKLGIDKIKKTPKTNATFNMFFQQLRGFSIVAREYILDDIQSIMKEFRRHTMIMGCIEQRSFLVNSGEITEVDKKLHQQNYNFSTYSKQVERQKSFKKMSIFEQKKKEDSPLKPQKDSEEKEIKLLDSDSQRKTENATVEQQQPKPISNNNFQVPRPSLYSYRAQQRLQQQQQQEKSEQQPNQQKVMEQQTKDKIETNTSDKSLFLQINNKQQENSSDEIIKLGTIISNQEPYQYNAVSLPVTPHEIIRETKGNSIQQGLHSREQSAQVEESKLEQKSEISSRPTYTRFNYTQQRMEQIRGNLQQYSYRGPPVSYGHEKSDLRIDVKSLDQNF